MGKYLKRQYYYLIFQYYKCRILKSYISSHGCPRRVYGYQIQNALRKGQSNSEYKKMSDMYVTFSMTVERAKKYVRIVSSNANCSLPSPFQGKQAR